MAALNPIIVSHPTAKQGEPGVDLKWPSSAIWRPGDPAVNRIGLGDLKDALFKGIDDFTHLPSYSAFLILFYPIVGLILFRMLFGLEMLSLLYPVLAGMVLLGPFVAVGLYELSRRREAGYDVSAQNILDVLESPSIGQIALLGLALVAIFLGWLFTAETMYRQIMGGQAPASFTAFANEILQTHAGWRLMVVGNFVGFLFALVALMISAVSFPLLVDQKVSAATAVRTSVRAFVENPVTMAAWGLIVAVSLLLGALPFFFGLAIVLPVLGHATWHLYRKVVSRTQAIDASGEAA